MNHPKVYYRVAVLGKIKAQPRPHAARRGNFVTIYNPKTADAWKQSVRSFFKVSKSLKELETLNEPLTVRLNFYFKRPKSHFNIKRELRKGQSKAHIQKPDIDNLVKAVLDAIVDEGIMKDDKLITELYATKKWVNEESVSEIGRLERCEIEIKSN